MDQKTIKEYIRALEHMLNFMRGLLDEEFKTPIVQLSNADSLKEFTNLKYLAKSDKWPAAVDASLICAEDEDVKYARASNILSNTKFIFNNKRVLDFGCGEGHVAYLSKNLYDSGVCVGYDITSQNWDRFDATDNLFYTTNYQDVLKHAPYEIIIANDVIDHVENPNEFAQKISQLKSPDCQIFIRCHPWTSRHATHLYKKLNKAYLHLIFSKKELYSMGLKGEETQVSVDPMKFYENLFFQNNLTIQKFDKITCPLELFFTLNADIMRRIKSNWFDSEDPELAIGTKFARDILEIQFIDYWLN